MLTNEIIGAKGGGGSGSPPPPRGSEIASVAYMKMLIALGEGEIAGGFDGRHIFLDGTPLQDANGNENFAGVRWEWRSGVQDQPYIQGFPNASNEIAIGTELKFGTPWVKAIQNTQLSAVRISAKFPAGLFKMRDDGVKDGHRVEYAIDIATDGGAYVEYGRDAADGIANTGYSRDYRINLPEAKIGWQLRIRRLTENINDGKHADTLQIASMTEIVDAKLQYPHTALLYVEFDSKLFEGRTPTVTVLAKGRLVRVPDNYNPETREYSGVWSGQWKWAWTNNPAWIFFDIVTNPRFGLGKRISVEQVDRWEMYRIAQYCDQAVPDGRGGMEPRFMCDVCISSQADAWTVLMDLASIFRGMISWSNNLLTVQADMPEALDPDYIFTRANIVDGSVSRAGTTVQSHYSGGLCTYKNPDNNYQDDQTPVFVYDLVKRFQYIPLEMTAVGCQRETEAQRRLLWAIWTNAEGGAFEWKTGLEGGIPRIGKVVGLANNLYAGRAIGGRISAASGRSVTVDRDITAKSGDRLIVNLPTGKSEGRTVSSVNGRVITVTVPYSVQPVPEAQWGIDADDLALTQVRVKKIAYNDDQTFTISGIQYSPNKYPRIDSGAVLEDRPTSVLPVRGQEPPTNIKITSGHTVNQGITVTTMEVSWDPAKGAIAYEAQWRQNNGNWINVPRSGANNFSITGIYAGRYQVRVRAISPSDVYSLWANSAEVQLTGKEGAPPALASFTATGIVFGITLDWLFPKGAEDTQKTEVWSNATNSDDGAMHYGDYAYPQRSHTVPGLAAGKVLWFKARIVDRLGNVGPWSQWTRGMASDDAGPILDYIAGQIGETELGKDVLEKINNAATEAELDDARREIQGSLDTLGKAAIENALTIDQTRKDLAQAEAELNRDLDEIGKATESNAASIEQTRQDLAQAESEMQADIASAKDEISTTRDELKQADADLQAKVDAITGGDGSTIADVVSQITKLQENDVVQAEKLDAVVAKSDGNASQIAKEQKARADADSALAKEISSVKSTVDGQQGAITKLEEAQADASSALAKVESNVSANAKAIGDNKTEQGKINTQVTQKTEALADQQKTQGQQLSGLTSEFNDNKAEVTKQLTTLADADSAQAKQISGLETKTGENAAAIASESKARTDADSALSQRIDVVKAGTDDNASAITELRQAQSDAEGTSASLQQSLEATAKANIETALKQAGDQQEQVAVNAKLTTSQTVLADQQQAQAKQLTQLDAQFGENAARLQQEISARATADEALATRLDTLNASVGDNQAKVTQQLQALADTDSAQAKQISGLETKTGENAAAIASESKARTDADSALSQRIDVVKAGTDDNASAITELRQAQSDAEGSNASLQQSLEATAKANIETALKQVGDQQEQVTVNAKLTTSQTVLADQQQAQAKQLTQLDAQFGENAARLQQEISARATADEALATRLDTLNASVGDNQAKVTQQLQALADTDSAQAKQISGLETKTGENAAAIASESKTRTDADSALGQRIDTVSAKTEQAEASITELKKTVADAESAMSQQTSSISASTQLNGESAIQNALKQDAAEREGLKVTASITRTQEVLADQQGALAKEQTTLTSQVGENTAQLQKTAQTVVDVNGGVSVKYAIKMGVNWNGTYYGAGMYLGAESTPQGVISQVLFDCDRFALVNVIDGKITTPFVIQNGQMVVASAFIGDATITNEKIGEVIQSNNFVQGMQGWRITKSGGFEMYSSREGYRSSLGGDGYKLIAPNGVAIIELGFFD